MYQQERQLYSLRVLLIALFLQTNMLGVVWLEAAEDCGNSIACNPEWKYPVWGIQYPDCTTRKVACLSHPDAQPGFEPLRAPYPICARLTTNGSSPNDVFMKDEDNGNVKVFDKTKMQEDLDAAVEAWNCICGVDAPSPVDECCVDVRWSKNPNDFEDEEGSGAGGDEPTLGRAWFSVSHKIGGPDCDPMVSCNGQRESVSNRPPTVIMNNTSEFKIYNTPTGSMERFFATGSSLPKGAGGISLAKNVVVYSFRSVCQHELGHELMLPHTVNKRGEQICQPPTGPVVSAMTASAPEMVPFYFEPTPYDKCLIANLYCPAIVGINELESVGHSGGRLPGTETADRYRFKSTTPDVVLSAYTVNGALVHQISSFLQVSDDEFEVSLRSLPIGVYLILIETKDGHLVTARKVTRQ